MNPDTAEQVIRIADGLERALRPVGRFLDEKIIDKVSGDVAGPVLDVPQKVSNLGPLALRQLGYGPGDPIYDHAADLQQAFDTDPLPRIGGSEFGDRVIVERHADDVSPGAPPADVATRNVIDP